MKKTKFTEAQIVFALRQADQANTAGRTQKKF